MKRVSAASLLLVLAACSSSAGELSLKNCRVGSIQARCGSLNVAENRSEPKGRRIDLNIVILPAKSKTAKPDPLFFFHGGPGGAATTLAAAFANLPFREERDIVLVDQRGTGRSNLIACGQETLREALASLARFDLNRQIECLQAIDADPRHYTTREFVADIDEVRQALGAETINIFGGSYGTRAAFEYLDTYPKHSRSAILRGVAPTDFTLPRDFPRDSQAALDGLIDDCAANGDCNRRYPDLRNKVMAIVQRLEAAPEKGEIRDPKGGPRIELSVDRDLFAASIHYALYSSSTAARLPSLSQFVSAVVGTLSDGLFLSVTCAEDLAFLSDEEIRSTAEGTLLGSAFGVNLNKTCEDWPHVKREKSVKVQKRSEVPILLINGQYDPVTPPHHTEKIMSLLPNAMHLIIPGQAHANMFPGCVQKLATQFLKQGSAKALSTDCVKQQGRPAFR
jgi:pimeloyl-ACP methyl ester carboxylesterase